jgi:urease accessory protein
MLKATELIAADDTCDVTLTLPYESRQKSRLRASLDNGIDIGLMLPRGTILRGGDCIRAEDGTRIMIQAADETVSVARIEDKTLFARACYHLGNRHVPLQIGDGWLRYLHDHVLDDMLGGLGIHTTTEQAPFEPEAGAYGGGHHHHHEH